jgi:hypothetical protein
MDHTEALKHLQRLIMVATSTDDLDEIHRLIREMALVINNALGPPPRPKPTLRSIK